MRKNFILTLISWQKLLINFHLYNQGTIMAAPFFHVEFAHFWLADQLNSLVPALNDFQYLICFYATSGGNFEVAGEANRCVDKNWMFRPFVACLPAWFRFMQCLRRYRDTKEAFPHLVNAGKYSTTFLVVLFSTLNNYYRSNLTFEPFHSVQLMKLNVCL